MKAILPSLALTIACAFGAHARVSARFAEPQLYEPFLYVRAAVSWNEDQRSFSPTSNAAIYDFSQDFSVYAFGVGSDYQNIAAFSSLSVDFDVREEDFSDGKGATFSAWLSAVCNAADLTQADALALARIKVIVTLEATTTLTWTGTLNQSVPHTGSLYSYPSGFSVRGEDGRLLTLDNATKTATLDAGDYEVTFTLGLRPESNGYENGQSVNISSGEITFEETGQPPVSNPKDWTFVVGASNEAIITGYKGSGGDVVIPSSLSGYTVRKIGPGVESIFRPELGYENFTVTSAVIPHGVTDIRDRAFQYSAALTNISIPNTVTNIEFGAFHGCRNLNSALIPESVTSIGRSSFKYCTALTNVRLPPNMTELEDDLFSGCSSLFEIAIPHSVLSIGSGAFANCSELRDISLPHGITNIGNFAFINCFGLTNVSLPSTVENIGAYAFKYCANLSSVTIPDSVTNVGANAFSFCSSLSTVEIPTSITNLAHGVFESCISLTNVVIPSSIVNIDARAFANCTGLTNMAIPHSVQSIGAQAFYGCEQMANVTLGTNVAFIGPEAFARCRGLTSVALPASVNVVGYEMFNFCENLVSVLFAGRRPGYAEAVLGTYSTNVTIYYIANTGGWDEVEQSGQYWGRPVIRFSPVMTHASLLTAGPFELRWTNTGTFPMNVRRATSLGGPWTVVSTNNATGQFVDPNPPSGKAFYQAYLP